MLEVTFGASRDDAGECRGKRLVQRVRRTGGDAAVLSNLDARAHEAYALDGIPSLVLIRPDGHIAFREPAERPEFVKAYCEKAFGTPPVPAG